MEGGNGSGTEEGLPWEFWEGMRVSLGSWMGISSWDDCYYCLPAVFPLFVALLYPLLAIELLDRLHSGLIVAFIGSMGTEILSASCYLIAFKEKLSL